MAKITPQVNVAHTSGIEALVIGMTEEQAIETLRKNGITNVRIMENNGEHFVGTCEFRPDRVSLSIKNDLVYKVARG